MEQESIKIFNQDDDGLYESLETEMNEQMRDIRLLVNYFFCKGSHIKDSNFLLSEAYHLGFLSDFIREAFFNFRGIYSDFLLLKRTYDLLIYCSVYEPDTFEDTISLIYSRLKEEGSSIFNIKDKDVEFINASHAILNKIDSKNGTKHAEIFYKAVIFSLEKKPEKDEAVQYFNSSKVVEAPTASQQDNSVINLKNSDGSSTTIYLGAKPSNNPKTEAPSNNNNLDFQSLIKNASTKIDIGIEETIERLKKDSLNKDPSKIVVFDPNDLREIEGHTLLPKLIEKGNYRSLHKVDNFLASLDELRHDFPNMHDFIDFVEENSLLNQLGNGAFHIPPSLLVGDPGIGKTFFLSVLLDKAKISHSMVHMESLSGSFPLTGASPQWKEAKSGIIFNSVINSEYANNAIILDEVDKILRGNYSPENSLLQFLEDHTAKEFKDEFCPIKIDVSNITWLATANEIHNISTPMLSRLNTFKIKMPNFEERKILVGSIYRSLLSKKTWGHAFSNKISDVVLDKICIPDSSIRNMKQDLLSACGKAVKNGRKELHLEDFNNVNTNNKAGPLGF